MWLIALLCCWSIGTTPGPTGFAATLAVHSTQFAPVIRQCTDLFALIFTSGTSGRAKGVPWSLAQLLQLAAIMEDVVDLQEQDTYWCYADPGWGLGMGCTLTAPLLTGHSTVLYEGPFEVQSTVRVIAEAGVTNLVAAPTVFRMMRASGEGAMAPIVGRLRCITSGGEPLQRRNQPLGNECTWAADQRSLRADGIRG